MIAITPCTTLLIEIKLLTWSEFVVVWFVILVVEPCSFVVFILLSIHIFSLVMGYNELMICCCCRNSITLNACMLAIPIAIHMKRVAVMLTHLLPYAIPGFPLILFAYSPVDFVLALRRLLTMLRLSCVFRCVVSTILLVHLRMLLLA